MTGALYLFADIVLIRCQNNEPVQGLAQTQTTENVPESRTWFVYQIGRMVISDETSGIHVSIRVIDDIDLY